MRFVFGHDIAVGQIVVHLNAADVVAGAEVVSDLARTLSLRGGKVLTGAAELDQTVFLVVVIHIVDLNGGSVGEQRDGFQYA
ncbi:hypothetical protein SDC9_196980 [bioreactor metagenome]|uniref:Uncharacterized protein n=1 Tax=bioreactor metagenome TaxID=1076179 RepID=A0A645IE12_9ZZZZ